MSALLAEPPPHAAAREVLADLADFCAFRYPLAPHTWYRVGGPAEVFARPRNRDELARLLRRCDDQDVPVRTLGLGANVLVADDGVPGVVLRLDDPAWQAVEIDGDRVIVGGGCDVQKLTLRAAREGLAGLECMAGIPGTVGGCVRMNAGGRFGDFGSRVLSVALMDNAARTSQWTRDHLDFGYRSSNLPADAVVLSATLDLRRDDPAAVGRRTREVWAYKRDSQPLNTKNEGRSAGCMFKNPPGDSAGRLIDAAGCKGLAVGGAEVSRRHANFVVARDGCRAADLLALSELVKGRVADAAGVALEREVQVWP